MLPRIQNREELVAHLMSSHTHQTPSKYFILVSYDIHSLIDLHIQADWEAAGQKLGFPVIPDINAGVETLYGFAMEQFTIASNGSRDGTNEAYLQVNQITHSRRLVVLMRN